MFTHWLAMQCAAASAVADMCMAQAHMFVDASLDDTDALCKQIANISGEHLCIFFHSSSDLCCQPRMMCGPALEFALPAPVDYVWRWCSECFENQAYAFHFDLDHFTAAMQSSSLLAGTARYLA
jgi:hypothetical protein